MGLGYIGGIATTGRRAKRKARRRQRQRPYGLGGASSQYTITPDIQMILGVESTITAYAASVGGFVRPMPRGTGIRIR